MSLDCFLLLTEPRRPWLDADVLKERFFTLSAIVHPDRVHGASEAEKLAATAHYTQLNAAYHCLREPKDRLRHLLELELGHKPSDLTRVPDDLMELFSVVGKILRETEAFRGEQQRATSPLLKVALFERGQEWADKLGEVRAKISPRREALLAELREMDAAWPDAKPLDRLAEIWRLLGYYDRWLAQLQERAVQLVF
ncbi:MAG: hypothetical protein RLZZ350_2510 [Verrucomicrobiota bacterium]